ncbi:hypothetical protein C0989_002871 [Termitomyces sp. Mn162]|nr:hypothetical protein C0989_002871 [Termitomyces sp. Mn162]
MFDTAEAYAAGQSEVEMGRAMKELGLRRTDLVITTKLFWGIRTGPNDGGLSRKHMFHRERPEKEYEPLYKKYGLGTTTFSSLAAGLLTGKYNDGIPEGSRFATVEMFQRVASRLQQEEGKEEIRKVRELTKIAAEELQTSPAALALAWVAKNPNTSTVILGASSAEQLKENLKALEVLPRLTPEIMEKIEAILNNKPSPPVNYGRPPLDPLGRSSVFRTGQY